MSSRIPEFPCRLIVAIAVTMALVGVCVDSAHAAAPKQADCIAVMTPELEGVPGNAADSASGARDLIASYLQGPTIKAIALEAKLPSLAAEEAKQKGCASILVTSIRRKSSSHGFLKALGQAAGSSSYSLPYGGSSVGSTIARAGTTAGLQTVSSMAQSTKAKDELSLEYKLESADGTVEFGPKAEHRTAKIDGEDLLTPVVERVAESIVAQNVAGHATASPANPKNTGEDYDSAAAVRYLDDLKTCTPYTWKYPNPLVPGSTSQNIIHGKKGDKCRVTYLMPNNLKADCDHSAETIKQITSESAYQQARSGEYNISFHLSSSGDSPFNRECHLFQGSKELPLAGQ